MRSMKISFSTVIALILFIGTIAIEDALSSYPPVPVAESVSGQGCGGTSIIRDFRKQYPIENFRWKEVKESEPVQVAPMRMRGRRRFFW